MTETHALLNEIEAFVARTKMAESTFGRLAVNDGKLVARLRAGGSITLNTAADIRRFIAKEPASEPAGQAA